MQIYHVETQEDYDALMDLNSKHGIWWADDTEPTEFNFWQEFRNETCVMVKENIMYYSPRSKYIEIYPDIPIQKYKAKSPGTKMQEGVSKLARAMKQNDVVNSPNHYTQGEYEVIDILEDKLTSDEYMGFLKGNVTKYNFRELYKNQDEDIAKAEFYQKKMKEFVVKGKTIYSRIAKRFTKATGYEFDSEFIEKLESGELKIVETDDGSWVNDPTGDIY